MSRLVQRNRSLKTAFGALLLCLMIAAEAIAVAHSSDLDAHATGDACKICIGVADFGGGIPPSKTQPVVPPATAAAMPRTPAIVEARDIAHAEPRGPPQQS